MILVFTVLKNLGQSFFWVQCFKQRSAFLVTNTLPQELQIDIKKHRDTELGDQPTVFSRHERAASRR